jgi:hypothetical protein
MMTQASTTPHLIRSFLSVIGYIFSILGISTTNSPTTYIIINYHQVPCIAINESPTACHHQRAQRPVTINEPNGLYDNGLFDDAPTASIMMHYHDAPTTHQQLSNHLYQSSTTHPHAHHFLRVWNLT